MNSWVMRTMLNSTDRKIIEKQSNGNTIKFGLTRLSIKSGPKFLKNSELHIWPVSNNLDLFHHSSIVFLAPFCMDFQI